MLSTFILCIYHDQCCVSVEKWASAGWGEETKEPEATKEQQQQQALSNAQSTWLSTWTVLCSPGRHRMLCSCYIFMAGVWKSSSRASHLQPEWSNMSTEPWLTDVNFDFTGWDLKNRILLHRTLSLRSSDHLVCLPAEKNLKNHRQLQDMFM